jgi:hypothetical protein
MFCTFVVLKFNKLRELNTLDSNNDNEELPKSRDIRFYSSLPLKLFMKEFPPTISNFILMSRISSPGRILSVKSIKL